MRLKNFARFLLVTILFLAFGCQRTPFDKQTVAPASLRDLPSLKLNFRFEPDVPPPAAVNQQTLMEEKNAAIQADFDANRSPELLEKTFSSPDKQRLLALYRKPEDLPDEFRLDVYSADGKLIRKITPNGMAIRYPETTVWSPDSNSFAFVARTRLSQPATAAPAVETAPLPPSVETNTNVETNANTNASVEANVNTASDNANSNAAVTPPATEPAKAVLTFRTEQIYVCNREGLDLKPITQNEGLIYFYFVWSPDSSALIGLASTWREWQVTQSQAELRTEIFVPAGRPRLIEKNGRERRLDDSITTVQPVWSPDSAKVAVAFDKEIRVYDAIGDVPTQAAIPLRNPLLISSKTYDEQKRREMESAGSNNNSNSETLSSLNVNTNVNAIANTEISSLPDENSLVSFNPITRLEWTEDKTLYLQTGYIREMKNTADSAYSYQRWHRLLFSPQPVAIN